MRNGILCLLAVGASLILPAAAAAADAGAAALLGEFGKAALAGDWKAIAGKTINLEEMEQSPVLRALKGHAALALNKNNEAFSLFLSLESDKDKQAWKAWAGDLAAANPDNHVALYLKGDALARCGESDAALREASAALKMKPDCAPALIVRGTLLAEKERWNDARKDLDAACEMKDPLAEAFVSRGTLQVLKKAPEGAEGSFNRALALSPGYALAINGLGCAQYGLAKWKEANKSFVDAAKEMPISLFIGNLRALAVAAENLYMPGMDDSPLFRLTDFIDWTSLSSETEKEGDVLRTLLGFPLPKEIDADAIEKLNKALETPGFYDKVKAKLDLKDASKRLLALIDDTAALRRKAFAGMAEQDKASILMLNRLILEHAYPCCIAKHNQRDPGTQLTFTKGFMDMGTYMNQLTPQQLAGGQWRKDHIWRPMQDALASFANDPISKFVSKQWGHHLDLSDKFVAKTYNQKYGGDILDIRPGGVTTDMRLAFIDKGEWPVITWFGLAHSTPFESKTAAKGE